MKLRERQWIIGAIFLLITFIYQGRLVQMQVFAPQWKAYASRLTEETETLESARGLIRDRNGEIIVNNKAGYDVWFTPRKCKSAGGLDTLALADLIEMTPESLISAFKRAENYATYRPSRIQKQLITETYARISGEIWRFPGVEVRRRSIRTNPLGLASHLVGEFREVDQNDLESNLGYRLGDYKGKSGLELQWETTLRGKQGARHHIVDIRNDYREPARSGMLDTLPEPGIDIQLTLDLDLQAYGERIMSNKRGAIVAIEPTTGEVLAMVSAPTYGTDLLTGRDRGSNYDSLINHPDKPLFNRTLRATYRPGSIFKMVQGLIAMDRGVLRPSQRIACDRSIIGCHGHHQFDNFEEAIVHSCNPYFHEVMKRMIQDGSTRSIFSDAHQNLGNWSKSVRKFGLGTDLGGHFPALRSGSVPDTADYDRMYGRKRWAYSTIYSISIGEGELLTTPMHMANLAAILANKGYYVTPHAVRGSAGIQRIETEISSRHYDAVIRAMSMVINTTDGTGTRAATPGIEVCGKTGTVQNPQGNHSVFIAFAPAENPKIALSVYMENAGAGGDWAAPIASLMIEKYLHREVTQSAKEQRIIEATYPFPDKPL
ncbi:MAG TPA: peptidoglycan glycosyltransferase [Flavobacteriales bacterium]|nr:peptidoglycan glycosyltransferase [Flavobacteriales bacterium]